MARMDLTPYVDRLGEELAAIADAVGEDVRAAAARLTPALGSAMRLTLLAALSAATDEITLDLAGISGPPTPRRRPAVRRDPPGRIVHGSR